MHATELDSGFAAAHLYLSMLSLWTDDFARTHHLAASVHREQLGARDRLLLDAYEPAMAVQPNLDLSAERLMAARAAFPNDWLILHALAITQIKRAQLGSAMEIVDDLLRREPALAMAWADKAMCFGLLDDLKNAREGFATCIRISPYATSCLGLLADLNKNEGECAEAEEHLRTLSVSSPTDFRAMELAEAFQGRRAASQSVHEALEQAWQLAPEANREVVRQRNQALFSARYGAFSEAQRAIDAWGKAIANERYEKEHLRLAKLQFNLLMELGESKRAGRLASEYLTKREAWLGSSYFDQEIKPLRMQYVAGELSREVFQQHRADWLRRQSTRPQLVDELNERWIFAYGLAAANSDDATEAIHELPHYLPITDSFTRDIELDYGIGRAYLLAGDPEHSLPYLRRASGSCKGLRLPFEYMWSTLSLGAALEKTGDVDGACGAYEFVVSQWGTDQRSVSAKLAAARRSALHCSMR